MDEGQLRRLLRQVRSRKVPVADALARLRDLPFAKLGYATLDTHRQLRVGFPEVIFGERKTVDQLVGLTDALQERRQPVLITRVSPEKGEAMSQLYPKGRYHAAARIFEIRTGRMRAGQVAVVTAGTSDVPVAEEAGVTAEALGATVTRVYDVGVAGIHRLLRRREEIQRAQVAVVVAGMEGALASAVGGLVGIPVVAVPTSVGYGANFHGLSALLAMLNSCAPNVAVTNIDNGFGAGFYAALISRIGRGSRR